MSNPTATIFEFGNFRFDTVRRELRRDGELVSVTPKILDTLRVFVQSDGQVVTKDELMNEVWGEAFVEESGLMRNISVLRKALGEQAGEIPYIVTVPRQGYRFLASVKDAVEIGSPVVGIRERTSTRIIVEQWEVASDERSLAVLPFRVAGDSPAACHVGLGMADALITKLSNIRGLKIRPTSSILKFGDADYDRTEAIEELDVDSVIEGTIWHMADRLRVTVQLVDSSDGISLWADKFDAAQNEIFDIQDAISERVAAILQFGLSSGERKLLTKRDTDNLDAYRLYVRALFLMHHFTPRHTAQAIPLLEQAISLDPKYALAHAYLVGCYLQNASFNVSSASEIAPIVRPLAEKTLALDPELPGAHYAKAFVYLYLDWDLGNAERSFLKAYELNPNDAIASKHLGVFLFAVGRFDEAIAQAKRTRDLDPVTASNTSHVGLVHYYARRFEESIAWHQIALEMDSTFVNSQIGLAGSLVKIGAFPEAMEAMSSIDPSAASEPNVIAARGYIAASCGRKNEAKRALKILSDLSKGRYISSFDIASIHAELGNVDEAFAYLENALDERAVWLVFLKVNPRFDRLRSDSRFDSILQRVGFPALRHS